MKIRYVLWLFLFVFGFTTSLWTGAKLAELRFTQTNSKQIAQTLGLKDYLAQGGCQEPTGGCGYNYYWDFNTCTCVYSGGGGGCTAQYCGTNYYWDTSSCSCKCASYVACPTNYYWDTNSCSCVYSQTTCTEPSGGCGTNYSWNSSTCSCVYSPPTCVTPVGGCGTNYYWNTTSCSCVYSGGCSPPTSGCSTHHYWDQTSCSCMYDGSCTMPSGGCGNYAFFDYTSCQCVTSCNPPAAGCGSNYYWDSATCSCKPSTSCTPPSSGCGSNYYWDYSTCSCKSYTSCTAPTSGCGTNYYWDNYSCSCKSTTACSPPFSGCGTSYYWDSYSCMCKSSCYEPTAGCGYNYFWDYASCICKPASVCSPPSAGCGADFYWDSYYCSCKPYQGASTTSSCNPPASGCGTNYYWDTYSCNCKKYPTYYTCTKPSSGCGYGWFWDEAGCICKSESDSQTYYSAASYSPYVYQQNFDRLSYETPEIIKCIKSVLTPTEYERLRYLVPANDKERDEVHSLGDKAKTCWSFQITTSQGEVKATPIVVAYSLDKENCLIQYLGDLAYREINTGKRQPTYDEHLKFEKCFGKVSADPINYLTNKETFPKTVDDCLKNVLSEEVYKKVKTGESNIPYENKNKVDRCFGIDPQPFEQGRNYRIPEEIKNCLKESIGEARFNEINSGINEPTNEEKKKADICFAKLNKDQLKFLPPPSEQIPYLLAQPEKVNIAQAKQDTKKYGDRTVGDKVILSGKSLPDSVITIYIYSEPIVVTTKTDENGDWVYELNQPLEGEKHVAYATVKDQEGSLVRSSVFDFQVLAAEPEMVIPFIEEAKATPVQNKFITYAFILIAAAVLLGMSGTTFVYLKKMNPRNGLVKKPSRPESGSADGEGETDTGSGSVD